jgi:hypothetical protein
LVAYHRWRGPSGDHSGRTGKSDSDESQDPLSGESLSRGRQIRQSTTVMVGLGSDSGRSCRGDLSRRLW